MSNETTIFIFNSSGTTIGILDVTKYRGHTGGFLSVNCEPVSYSVDLKVAQMRMLAAKLIAIADECDAQNEGKLALA